MPGSIRISMLGLMDFSSPPQLSSLFLTVAMGKREYQTVGGGELSLPVASLRENVVVMVHDAEGEEVLRTEFRTMLLLEQGLWDNLFPLKNGGSLHLKLQFLLNEEDRKRIREMRDSAIKKRHMGKPGTRRRRSFSDNKIGYLPTRTTTEIITEGMLLDNSEPADPIAEPYFGQSDKFPAGRIGTGGFPRNAVIGEGDTSNLNFCKTMSKSFSAGMLSEISSKGKSNYVKASFFPKEMENAIPAMHCETRGDKDLQSDAKIHKLDIGAAEIKETKNKSSDATPYSSKSGSSITIDNIPKTIGSGKSTRLASETFSERKNLTSVDLESGPSIIPLIRNFETVREKENLNLIQKGGIGLGSNAASETFKARPSSQSSTERRTAGADHSRAGKKHNSRNVTTSEGVNRKIIIVDAENNNNEERSLRDKSLPLKEMLNDLEKIDHPCLQGSLGEVARKVSNENMQQSPSNEQTVSSEHSTAAKMSKSRNWPGHGDAASSEGVNKTEILDFNENNNKERYTGYSSLSVRKMDDELEKIKHPYQQGASEQVAKTANDENNLQSPSTPGSSYEKAEALKPGYSSECPMGFLGTDHSRAGEKHSTINMARDGNVTSSEGVNRKIIIVDTENNNNEELSLRDKSLPLKEMLNDLEKIDHPCQQGSLGEVARKISNENMQQSPSNEQTVSSEHSTAAKMRKSRNWPDHGDAASSEGVNRTLILDKERFIGYSSLSVRKMDDELEKVKHPYQQGASVEVAKTANDENNLRSPSTPGSSYEKAEAFKSGYSSECPMGFLGTDHSRAGENHSTINMARDGNLTSSEGVNSIVDAENNNNEERSLRAPLKEMLNDLEMIDHPCQQGSLGEVARKVSNENMQQSPSNEQTVSSEHSTAAKMRKSRNWPGHGDAASSEGVNRTEILDFNENNNKERYIGDSSLSLRKMDNELEKIKHPYQQGASVEVAKTANDENYLQSPSTPGSSYEKAEALKYGYSSEYPMGFLGAWIPRHLCITTGSKMLRELVESCTVSSKTNSFASSFMRDAEAEVHDQSYF